MTKTCSIHGETIFMWRADGVWRCRRCVSVAVQKKRQNIKLRAIEYKGGKCICCGYNKSVRSLTFHHVDPNEKEFGIGGRGQTRSWEKIKKELDKCVLVCANCHGEIHEGILDITSYL